MATLVLNAYSKAYPLITNNIRAAIYKQTDPLAIVASIVDSTLGHPARTWHFPGLERTNYRFSLDEIDGGGNPINNLADFDVVPGQLEGALVRGDEQYQVGVSPGFVAGTNTFTFDGTETAPGSGLFKPDFRGWQITPSELTGRGILARGLDYSWDDVAGTMTLLQTGDIFTDQTYWNFHFDPKQQSAGGSVPTINDFGILLKTTTYSIAVEDFGKKILVEPAGTYMEMELPDIETVTEGRRIFIEMSQGVVIKTCKIIPFGASATPIRFMRGNIYMMGGELFAIYKYKRGVGDFEWRVDQAFGNWLRSGETVYEDSVAANIFNKAILDGSTADIQQYARFYNEIVLNLPADQVVNFDDWSTGNNKYKFSLSNSSDPANLNKFKLADRRDMFIRSNSSIRKSGDFQDHAIQQHKHIMTLGTTNRTSWQNYSIDLPMMLYAGTTGVGKIDMTSPSYIWNGTVFVPANEDLETRPVNFSLNQYVIL